VLVAVVRAVTDVVELVGVVEDWVTTVVVGSCVVELDTVIVVEVESVGMVEDEVTTVVVETCVVEPDAVTVVEVELVEVVEDEVITVVVEATSAKFAVSDIAPFIVIVAMLLVPV
jgi:hypothetical protein